MKIGMILTLFLLSAHSSSQTTIDLNDTLTVAKTMLYHDDFKNGLDNWTVEQAEGGKVMATNEKMEITDVSGCTIWFNKKLTAPLLIEYDAVVIDNGGPSDRVSDQNCFWLATDAENPMDFFTTSGERQGKFQNYDSLKLYYVGLGGHHNTKTRFRRYTGTGEKPLLPEHDLAKPEYLIEPNEVNHIKIVVFYGIVQYYRNGIIIYDYFDANPYTSGYFGIRTVDNHMTVDNFMVYSQTAVH